MFIQELTSPYAASIICNTASHGDKVCKEKNMEAKAKSKRQDRDNDCLHGHGPPSPPDLLSIYVLADCGC